MKEPESSEPEEEVEEEVHVFERPESPKPDPEEILREKELQLLERLHHHHCKPLVKLF